MNKNGFVYESMAFSAHRSKTFNCSVLVSYIFVRKVAKIIVFNLISFIINKLIITNQYQLINSN